MKTCSKCKLEKNESEYHACKKSKSGLQAQCKVCRNAQIKVWKEKNREEYLRKSREYAKREYDKHPEKFIERHNEWKRNNPEILVESNRRSCKKGYQKFKPRRKEYYKLYREVYAEEKKKMDADWRARNPEKSKESRRRAAKLYRQRYPEKQKARMLVQYAVQIGVLVRPMTCSTCNKECKPDGHHPDYSKPLEVIWLCRQCHNQVHGK